MKGHHIEIMVIFVPESPAFFINVFVVVTTAAACISTYLTVIRITTTVTQIRPTYFGISVNTIKHFNI
jgi:hypothetical protein